MVRNMAKTLLHDVSMFERLYTGPSAQGMSKTMLNVGLFPPEYWFLHLSKFAQVQYRFPEQLAAFPSNEFYKGRLRMGVTDATTRLAALKDSKFPWPTERGVVVPTVFVQCGLEEDMGGMSKSNAGQAEVVRKVIGLLTTRGTSGEKMEGEGRPKVTVLTPYTEQVSELKRRLPNDVGVFTIDSFQGRESDIVIFSTVRCNLDRDIGFLEDERRLNVVWTRAKLALIIVGDRPTLTEKNGLWRRALDSCTPVTPPSESTVPTR